MPLYEITLTASKVVRVHGDSLDEASQRAATSNPTLDEVEVTDGGEVDDTTGYDSLPSYIREVVDRLEAGEEMERLGIGQAADRMYDDGEWRVWRERVGPSDGYDGPPVTIEFYDGNRWSDFDPEIHDVDD